MSSRCPCLGADDYCSCQAAPAGGPQHYVAGPAGGMPESWPFWRVFRAGSQEDVTRILLAAFVTPWHADTAFLTREQAEGLARRGNEARAR